MIDIQKITATINTEEMETVELPPIVSTIQTRENFVELPKVVAEIRPETTIVGNLGTMVAGKGKDGKDGVDGRPGKDGIDGKQGLDGINGKDGKDGTTPHIGDNGNWFIDDFDTGVCAIGKTGMTGAPGKDGYTPRLGIDYFNGKDGIDGIDGVDGKDGYTPIKGVDYFDGRDGKDGKDGKNGRTPIKGLDYKDGRDGKDGLNGLNGKDGFSPEVSVEEIKNGYRITITDVDEKKTIDVLNGKDGERGEQGVQGVQGEKGEPFFISKVYESVNAMNQGYSTDGVKYGGFVVIDTGNVEDEDNAKLFYKGNTKYEYLTDLSGASGMQGPQGVQGIQGIQGERGYNGYSPVRGTDYWTDDDKAEIKQYVDDAILGGAW